MEQTIDSKLNDFRDVMAAIRIETDLMKKVILSEEEEKEENEILRRFNAVVETQVFSTLINLAVYQLRGWRELVDE